MDLRPLNKEEITKLRIDSLMEFFFEIFDFTPVPYGVTLDMTALEIGKILVELTFYENS